MGADMTVGMPCPVKQAFNGDDEAGGSATLLGLLKDRNRATVVMRQLPPGSDPGKATFTLLVQGPEGPVEAEISVAELLGRTAVLDRLATHCEGCPADVLGQPFGCSAVLSYPVPETTEQTLVERLQPAETLGGTLMLHALADFGYDGANIRSVRSRGLFEAAAAPSKRIGQVEVSSDVLFHAILDVGSQLQPTHCMLLLTWVGSLALDGQVPDQPSHLQQLTQLGPPERAARTSVFYTDDGTANLLLAMLHRSYVCNAPLHVDA